MSTGGATKRFRADAAESAPADGKRRRKGVRKVFETNEDVMLMIAKYVCPKAALILSMVNKRMHAAISVDYEIWSGLYRSWELAKDREEEVPA
jgi:hypothetical protein